MTDGLTAAVTKLELQLPVRKHRRSWSVSPLLRQFQGVFSICRLPSFIVSAACLLQSLICFQLLGLLDSIFIKVSSETQPLAQWSSFNGSVAPPLSLCLSVRPSVCRTPLQSSSALRNSVAQYGCPSHRLTTCAWFIFFLSFLVLQQCSSQFFFLFVHGYILIGSLVWYAPFFSPQNKYWSTTTGIVCAGSMGVGRVDTVEAGFTSRWSGKGHLL